MRDTASTGPPTEERAAVIAAGAVIHGRYRLDEAIGAGGFALVFRATDLLLGRQVAVKVFDPARLDRAQQDEFLRRFAAEARIVAALDHPNILAVHDFGEVDAWVDTFRVDGSLVLHKRGAAEAHVTTGHAALRAKIEAKNRRVVPSERPPRRHSTHSLTLQQQPDGSVRGRCYVVVHDYSATIETAAPPTIAATGVYRDVIVREADGWRFVRREITCDL